jgi:hypothetical protein
VDGSAFDLLLIAWIEWVFDPIEDRFGRVTAWLVTLGTSLVLIGAAVLLVAVLTR